MIDHLQFLAMLSRKKQLDSMVYSKQIVDYAENLDHFIRDEFAQIDLSPSKMVCLESYTQQQKKIVCEHLSQMKRKLAQHFEMIVTRVVTDILNAKKVESAVRIFSFWTEVAITAGTKYKNLELERAIGTGLSHETISRIFETPDNPGYQLLPSNIQESTKNLTKSNRYSKSLVVQTEFFPPTSVYFSCLEYAAQFKNTDSAFTIITNMLHFKKQLLDRTSLFQDIEPVANIAAETLEEDRAWDISSQLRDKFLAFKSRQGISVSKSNLFTSTELDFTHSDSSSSSSNSCASSSQSMESPSMLSHFLRDSGSMTIHFQLSREQRNKALLFRGLFDHLKSELDKKGMIADSDLDYLTNELRDFFASKEFIYLTKEDNGPLRAQFAINTGLPKVDIIGLYNRSKKPLENAGLISNQIITYLSKDRKMRARLEIDSEIKRLENPEDDKSVFLPNPTDAMVKGEALESLCNQSEPLVIKKEQGYISGLNLKTADKRSSIEYSAGTSGEQTARQWPFLKVDRSSKKSGVFFRKKVSETDTGAVNKPKAPNFE